MIQSRQEFIQNYRHAQGWWDDSLNVKNVSAVNLAWDTSYGGWIFTNASNRYIWYVVQMPHGKTLGTAIHPHLHWMPTTTNTGTVAWVIEYWWKNAVGDTAQGAVGTGGSETINATPNGTAYVLQLDAFTPIAAPASEAVSSLLTVRIYRDGTSDAYNDDALLKDFDCHLQLDQPGSILETSKWGT